MQLTQFLIVGLVLFTTTWRGGSVVATPSQAELSIVEDVIHILTSCYGDRVRGVVLAGNLPAVLPRMLSSRHSIPVTLVENSSTYSKLTPFPEIRYRQQLPLFVVGTSSPDELVYTIETNIRGSVWWNSMASFFILDRSPRCIYGMKSLYVAWAQDILNAKVICYHLWGGRRVVFGFNPYTIDAPPQWQRLYTLKTTSEHPFAVFFRAVGRNDDICVNLDFDKTTNLGGYEIKVEGPPPHSMDTIRTEATLNKYQYWSTRDRIFNNIFDCLNATPTYMPLMRVDDPIDVDVRKVGRLMLHVWTRYKLTYPHAHSGFILISQFRGHKSQLEKILCVIDFDSRLGMGVVYLVTLIFFRFLVCQATVPALLNLVRITCNTGFANLPDQNASRIFLGCLLFFVVTMQGIYQGNLATLLTTNIPLRNINLMKDVVDLDYRLCGNEFMGNFVKEYPELEGRFAHTGRSPNNCLAYVMNDSSTACLWIGQGLILDRVRDLELHTSSEFVANYYSGFEIRWDLPIEHRINEIISRMVEADVIPHWDVQCKPLELTLFKYDKDVLNNRDFKNIELAELAFAFVILGIGLVCATIVFVVEVAISPT